MEAFESAWVLGHRIRRWNTDDSYGLVEVTSPPKVPGPPPHFHKHEREFFLILKGELSVMNAGVWQSLGAGQFVELPPRTTHTFINDTGEDVVWITGWRPKGFERFFRDFGVAATENSAQQRSVAPEMIRRVVEGSERYGMFVSP
jgi:mannose-6-phosphate isomerase-like protein (cupin superfamily)